MQKQFWYYKNSSDTTKRVMSLQKYVYIIIL